MGVRSLAVLLLCLAFLGTQVAGLHFHVSDTHGQHESSALHNDDGHHDHHATHLTSEIAADHFAGHASNEESDVGVAASLTAKLPVLGMPILFVMFWLGFALTSRLSGGLRIPIQWMRPPDIRSWSITLLPPSQGPPRAV